MTNDNHEGADRFTALFKNATDAIASVRLEDGAFIVTDVNRAFEDVFGYDADTIVGEDIDEFVLPGETRDDEDIGDLMKVGEQVERQGRRRTTTGVRDFLIRSVPFELDDGWPGGYVIYTDISAQKQRERLLCRYDTILDVVADPVFTVDEAARLTFVNEPFAALVGADPQALLGTEVASVLGDHGAAICERYAHRPYDPDTDPVEHHEFTFDGPNGTERVFEAHFTLLPDDDGDFDGVASVMLDVTERRRQRERLESFASVVSHDLRNPLQVAFGRVDSAMRNADSADAAVLDEALKALAQMDAFINDLLSLAKSGQGALEAETVDLSEVARAAAKNVSAAADRVDVDDLGRVVAERTQLFQLFTNLFRNAYEHGNSDVRVRVEPLSDGFAVVDDGPGLPTDANADVFQRGFTTNEGGTGVGLTIVKRVATVNDWSVSASNDAETGGARFEVRGVEWTG